MAHPPAPAPYIAPAYGELQDQLAHMATAISGRALITSAPTYASVGLIAPDGSTWRITVDATGALHTTQVSRT